MYKASSQAFAHTQTWNQLLPNFLNVYPPIVSHMFHMQLRRAVPVRKQHGSMEEEGKGSASSNTRELHVYHMAAEVPY